MAKYKVGDIFINHTDGKILQVCEGDCCKDCCYNKVHSSTCLKGVSCSFLIGLEAYFKELPSLPPGTKVKMREDLQESFRYGGFIYCHQKGEYKEITIKTYNINSKSYKVNECPYSYTLEMFDQVINEPKINNMETKEIKIKVPEGYEIDKENSTFECIKFKPIKKELTYKDVVEELFSNTCYYTNACGKIVTPIGSIIGKEDKNYATSKEQLERLLALNQLLNIAEYYNKKSPKQEETVYCFNFDKRNLGYYVEKHIKPIVVCGLIPMFNRKEDAKAVINNPNFKEILDLIYKGDED